MPERASMDARSAIREVARFGLFGTTAPTAVEDGEWQSFAGRLHLEKLTGLAVAAVGTGTLEIPAHRTGDLHDRHRRAMVWCLRVEQQLLDLDERFRRSRIEYAVLKGPSVAHTAYVDPSLRGFGDLDVLVRGRDFKGSCAELRAMGFERRLAEPRPRFDERFGKAAVHRRDEDGMEIDLHRTLVLGPFGLWIEPDELLDRTTTFGLAGRRIPRLDDTGMLLSVAMHATLGWPPRLLPFRDVVEVSSRLNVDVDELVAMAERWRLSAVLDRAFRSAEEALGVGPVPWAARLASHRSAGTTAALESYLGRRRGRGGTAISTLRAIPRFRDKAAYVHALAFPRKQFMEQRYRLTADRSYRRRLVTPGRWAWSRLGAIRPSRSE
jgi:Uncharacterised nucleotidyltransferase